MNIRDTKRFLKKIGKSDNYLFRSRKYGVDDDVYCLQSTPLQYWLLTYMKKGEVMSEIYFLHLDTACYYIREHAVKNYLNGKNKSLDAFVARQKQILEKDKAELNDSLQKNKEYMTKYSRLWIADSVTEAQLNSIFDYEQFNRTIHHTRDFLRKLRQLKYFSLLPDFIQKDQTSGLVYDLKRNQYRFDYFDRNRFFWGNYFVSYQDAYLYLRMQAFSTFVNIQKLYLERWKKDIDEGKTWLDFLFHTKWQEMSYGYDSLSKSRLIKFLGNLKYGHNENMPESHGSNSGYSYTKKGFMRFEATANGQTKRFCFSWSAMCYLFKKEYEKQIPEYFEQFRNEKAVWLHIYESEFKAFETFYQNDFKEATKHICENYIQEFVYNKEFRHEVWNPDKNNATDENEGSYNPDFKPTLIERYGNLYGSQVSLYGTPFETLSMAPIHQTDEYRVLELQAGIEVESYVLVPAFGQPGGATVYVLPEPISGLMRKGVLKLIR